MSPTKGGVQLRWAESKRKRAPAISNEQWAQHRDEICRLHAGMRLDDLMLHLRARYDFCPSKHQLVLQLHKWGYRKYKSRGESKSASTSPPSKVAATRLILDKAPENAYDTGVTTEEALSYDGWEDLKESIPDLPQPLGDTVDLALLLPQTSTASFDHSHTRLVETVRTIERELEHVFEAYTEQDLTVGDRLQNPTALSRADSFSDALTTTSQDGSGGLSPSRSLRLQRVPRAQKRPRSISSLASAQDAPKKNKFHSDSASLLEDTEELIKSVDSSVQPTLLALGEQSSFALSYHKGAQASHDSASTWQVSPGSQMLSKSSSAVTDEGMSGVSGTASPASTSVSSARIETLNSDMPLSESLSHSPLSRLLTRARKGQVLYVQDKSNTESVSRLAWFFFGAGLYEEAFVLHLMVYKAIQAEPDASDSILFSHLINLARCSRSEGQTYVVKDLLLKASRKRHTGREGDSMENFLLHSFLTLMYRRQENLSKADHHCHRAIQWYKQVQDDTSVCNKWHSLSIVAWTLLRSNVTEKRLQIKASKLTNSVRHKVCAKASDQLIVRHWSSQVLNGTRHALDVLFTQNSADQSSSLRTLFEWCLQVIENHPLEFEKHQIWRRRRAAGINLRTLGMTTLYCQLWKAWHREIAVSSSTYKFSDYWSSTIEAELGITPSECLATIPDAIAMKWPSTDEDIPMLANWRTYQHELHKRAIGSLKDLLGLSDTQLAYHFFRSYSAHCIASSKDDLDNAIFSETHREYVISFANENSDLLLPPLALHEHVRDAKTKPFDIITSEYTEGVRGSFTRDAAPPASAEQSQRHLSFENPTLGLRTHRASVRSADSVSVDLASMKSIQRRIRERGFGRQLSDADNRVATRRTDDVDAMSIDDLMDLTRTSMRSLSLHEIIDPADADSLMKLLSDSLAQKDVTVY